MPAMVPAANSFAIKAAPPAVAALFCCAAAAVASSLTASADISGG